MDFLRIVKDNAWALFCYEIFVEGPDVDIKRLFEGLNEISKDLNG